METKKSWHGPHSGLDDPGHVFLLGFMGAGKTTVGQALSRLSGRQFVDLDHWIEENAGTAIKNIFADKGEDFFRGLESEALEAMTQRTRCVVATGGGIVGRPRNWELMRRLGMTVYLKNDWETIVARIADCPDRPLVTGQTLDGLRALFEQRQPLYEQADLCVVVKEQDPHEIARAIMEMLAGEVRRG